MGSGPPADNGRFIPKRFHPISYRVIWSVFPPPPSLQDHHRRARPAPTDLGPMLISQLIYFFVDGSCQSVLCGFFSSLGVTKAELDFGQFDFDPNLCFCCFGWFGRSSRGIWWSLKHRDPQMWTSGVLGLSCETPGMSALEFAQWPFFPKPGVGVGVVWRRNTIEISFFKSNSCNGNYDHKTRINVASRSALWGIQVLSTHHHTETEFFFALQTVAGANYS